MPDEEIIFSPDSIATSSPLKLLIAELSSVLSITTLPSSGIGGKSISPSNFLITNTFNAISHSSKYY